MKKKLIAEFKNFKVGTKIVVCYLLISLLSISFSTFIYHEIDKRIMTQKVSDMAQQTLQTINSSLNELIYTIDNESKIVLSNQGIQSVLKRGDDGFNYNDQVSTNRYLTEFIQSNGNISSIYILDNYDNQYFVDKRTYKPVSFEKVKECSWYNELLSEEGGYIVKFNGGGLFNESDQKYVSLMRVINDLDTQKPIGIMIVNIPEQAVINSFKNAMTKGDISILIKDKNNNNIIETGDLTGHDDEIHENESYFIKKVKGHDYIFSSLKIKDYDWTIVSKMPFKELSKELNTFYFTTFVVTIINAILMFIGAISISGLITNPIKKLLKSMKGVESGEFKKVDIEAGNDEIGKLRDGYNIMVLEIEKLINKIIDEQKIKRNAELSVLQAQVKPHFLYNTLDAMEYLALSGKCDEVYEALEALGTYYRSSLSKGREVITVAEEIDIVKNYFLLQKLRYGDIFTDTYEIDEKVLHLKMLKLVLQPIAENALYHGIKPKGEKGNIKLKAELIGNLIKISIEDNGVGMTEEELDKVIGDKIDENKLSFGLRGTIERLRIFYGISDVYEIESHKRYGTKVTITIPREVGVKNE